MQLNWLKTTWSGELAPKTVFVAISSARVSKTASHQDLLTVIIVASFSACMFLFWLLLVVDDRKTIAFAVGVVPPTVRKAAGEPAARSLVVRWSAQHNSRSSNCAQWNPPFCLITWRFFLTFSQRWIFRYGDLGCCVRKKRIHYWAKRVVFDSPPIPNTKVSG